MAVTRRSDRSSEAQVGGADSGVGDPVRFALTAAAAGVGFLVVAALWVSTCTEAMDVDTAACGVPQRTLLGLGAPVILLVGAVWAFVRTYRSWRDEGTWWVWQGAGWFLLTLMLLTLTMGFPALAGPALGS
jgi:hypothetical protein